MEPYTADLSDRVDRKNMHIVFTQYLRPHGKKKVVTIDRPERICNMASALKNNDYELSVEELTTGLVSMTVESRNDELLDLEGSLAHVIVPNDTAIPDAVDRLIETAYTKWLSK